MGVDNVVEHTARREVPAHHSAALVAGEQPRAVVRNGNSCHSASSAPIKRHLVGLREEGEEGEEGDEGEERGGEKGQQPQNEEEAEEAEEVEYDLPRRVPRTHNKDVDV